MTLFLIARAPISTASDSVNRTRQSAAYCFRWSKGWCETFSLQNLSAAPFQTKTGTANSIIEFEVFNSNKIHSKHRTDGLLCFQRESPKSRIYSIEWKRKQNLLKTHFDDGFWKMARNTSFPCLRFQRKNLGICDYRGVKICHPDFRKMSTHEKEIADFDLGIPYQYPL